MPRLAGSAMISFAVPLAEKALIAEIRRMATPSRQRRRADVGVRATRSAPAVLTGIGDDCAVLRVPPGHQMLVTTDFTLEAIHFPHDRHPPKILTHRPL